MTDTPVPPPEEPDHVDSAVELASAHVDGELDDAEQAQVAADGDISRLAVRLAAVAHEVRDLPPPPPDLVDQHVAAALGAMEDPGADAAPTVTPVHRGRPAPPWWQRVPLGAVAAVLVVVALIGVVGLLAAGGDDDDADTAASSMDATTEPDDSSAGADGAEREDGAATFDAGDGGPDAARPAYDDVEELVAAVAGADDAAGSGQEPAAEESMSTTTDHAEAEDTAESAPVPVDPCDAVTVAGADPSEVEQVVPALVDGDPVTAIVHVTDGEQRVVVVDDATCSIVFDEAR